MLRYFPERHQKVLRLSIPAAINSLLDMLQIITDLIMVGRLSAYAVASVGLGLQLLMLVYAVMTLLHVGTTALLSRFIGAGQKKRASTGLSTLLIFALFLSIPVSALWYLFAPQVYLWFGTAKEVVSLGSEYVTVLTWMLPFVFVKLVFVSALNSSGDTKTPMQIKIVSIVLNVVLNYLLIFGAFGFPELGVM
ncbi:MAG: MATE family efflux transporter, partial [Sulfurovum sp.]|nr:MATE family efflux transporter [Sulfurovum sp.]